MSFEHAQFVVQVSVDEKTWHSVSSHATAEAARRHAATWTKDDRYESVRLVKEQVFSIKKVGKKWQTVQKA